MEAPDGTRVEPIALDRGYGPRAVLKVTDGYGYHIGYFTLAELPRHVDLVQLRERERLFAARMGHDSNASAALFAPGDYADTGPMPPDWWAKRSAVLSRDGERCQACGGHATHVDYIVPRSLGGSEDEANLRSLCPNCHNALSGRLANSSETLPTGVGGNPSWAACRQVRSESRLG
jgi:HNH endonuclease